MGLVVTSGWLKKSSNELGYPHTEVGRPAGGAVIEGYQDVHAHSPAKGVPHSEKLPVIFVTDPELIIRPSVPVVTHFLDQKNVARKAKARKCAAKIVGNI